MAQKESIEKFFKNWHKFDDLIIHEALGGWNANTLVTMGKAQFYAPVDKGTLQGSARRIKAKITNEGIVSSFIFAVPYAFRLEKGKSVRVFGGGDVTVTKTININTSINPNAQTGYSSRAVDENEDMFVNDLNKSISKAWRTL